MRKIAIVHIIITDAMHLIKVSVTVKLLKVYLKLILL